MHRKETRVLILIVAVNVLDFLFTSWALLTHFAIRFSGVSCAGLVAGGLSKSHRRLELARYSQYR